MAETGHAKKENGQQMIAACTGFGDGYKPSNENLMVGSMTSLHVEIEWLMDCVQINIVLWKSKVADRENIYTEVQPRLLQLLGAFSACGGGAKKGRGRSLIKSERQSGIFANQGSRLRNPHRNF